MNGMLRLLTDCSISIIVKHVFGRARARREVVAEAVSVPEWNESADIAEPGRHNSAEPVATDDPTSTAEILFKPD